MFGNFYPSEYIDSTYQIDFEGLWEEGYRALVFDIDNTLVPHGKPADARAIKLFDRLKKIGFSCCLLSNNKEPRVKMFNDSVNVNMIYKAGKPFVKNYLKAVEICHATVPTAIFIGDQIFTDVYGANKAGIRTILVKPIHPKEEIQIVLKRYLEKIILYFYLKKYPGKTMLPGRRSVQKNKTA